MTLSKDGQPSPLPPVKWESEREMHVAMACGFRLRGEQFEHLDMSLTSAEWAVVRSASPACPREKHMWELLMTPEDRWGVGPQVS